MGAIHVIALVETTCRINFSNIRPSTSRITLSYTYPMQYPYCIHLLLITGCMKYLLLGEAHLEVNSFQKTEEGCLIGEAVGSSEATPAAAYSVYASLRTTCTCVR